MQSSTSSSLAVVGRGVSGRFEPLAVEILGLGVVPPRLQRNGQVELRLGPLALGDFPMARLADEPDRRTYDSDNEPGKHGCRGNDKCFVTAHKFGGAVELRRRRGGDRLVV